MKPIALFGAGFLALASLAPALAQSSDARDARDTRGGEPRTLNTPRSFTEARTKSGWQARARDIRENVLVSCGLWPLPEKAPLNAKIFGRLEKDGYSIEKVYFQTYPGFYLAGNLYRPLDKGPGPFPGILNPHGHWKEGRLVDNEDGSSMARCINFARQGMVAFAYDMVGYNDTMQVGQHRAFATNSVNLLWNISLMGLQTWNSVRALDFLESLPDVDPKRLACTGESGGGTQTFMLGAIEDRLAAQAPIVMVSHTMQGGCLCENAPGLRVNDFNVDIAASVAPRAQILVACTGDWTKATMTMEGPALESVYRLFKAPQNLRYVIFDYKHNYNKTSREAVYEWFGKHLLKHPDPSSLKETPYQKLTEAEMLVFKEEKLPSDALNHDQFIASLIKSARHQLDDLKPYDKRSLANYKDTLFPAYRHTLKVEFPERGLQAEIGEVKQMGQYTTTALTLGREGKGDRIPATMISPAKDSLKATVVLAGPTGKAAFVHPDGTPAGLARKLTDRGFSVLLLDMFQTGELANPAAAKQRNPFERHFTTYNRTDMQEQVQDLITACSFARAHSKLGKRTVILCGTGRAGLAAMLAAPGADAVVADCDHFDPSNPQSLLLSSVFVPGLLKIGAFEGVATLAAPNPLVLHNTGGKFTTAWLRDAYSAAGAAKSFRESSTRLEDDALVQQIANLKVR
ncbi:MAG: acetylxylan esterase [Verrucomicrobiota bacterium]